MPTVASDYRPLVRVVKRTGGDKTTKRVPVYVSVGGEPRRVTVVPPVAPRTFTPSPDSSWARSCLPGSSPVTVAVRSHGCPACKRGAFADGVMGLFVSTFTPCRIVDGPLGFAASKETHRLGNRTSPQVARRELISMTDSPAADHRLGGGWRRPPAPRVGARALPRYAGLWHTAQESSKGKPAHPGLIRWGKQSRGAPEGLAHHTGSLRKVTLKTLL